MVEVQTDTLATAKQLATQLRIDSIRSTTEAASGHPTSCMSAADLMAVLMTNYLKYDFDHPENENNDRLIFSKGHAAPLLYAMYKAAGAIDDKRSPDPEDVKTSKNYVKAALDEILAGKPVSDASTKSYGCSVKY